ncbi:hypothetical protein NDU88_002732 [Pleurodeles waltl]|uniref:t-SNARE coiled-coil homology domain-containing protein n=1 Tax=Pleurodeles waltl TaxID=8319 RepID=A0AAV7SCW4_PLEWA|nr:hypothetical protein NDU88_002732 [Pleurodeles waltl]
MRCPATRSSRGGLLQRLAGYSPVRHAEPPARLPQEGRLLAVEREVRTVSHAVDRILQEIAAVGLRLETMDSRISDLTVASSSIRADIAGFRETVNNLDIASRLWKTM